MARTTRNLVAAAALTGAAAAATIWLVTRPGIGLQPDSAAYIDAARELLGGRGLNGFSVDYPPLYSLLVAAVAFVGRIDVLDAARWISIGAFGATAAITAVVVGRSVGSAAAGIAAGALVATTVRLIWTSSWALTEPLFLFLVLATLAALDRYIVRPTWARLVACAVLAGLGALTRFVGLSLVLSGLILIAYHHFRDTRARIVRPLAFGAISLAGVAVWTVRSVAIAGSPAGHRGLMLRGIPFVKLRSGVEAFGKWLFPPSVVPVAAQIAVLVVLAAVGLYLSRSIRGGRPFVVFVGCYAVTVVASLLLIDANIPLDDRILSPIYLVLIVLGVFIAGAFLRSERGPRIVRHALWVALVGGVALSAVRTVRWIPRNDDGLGYASARWRNSALVRAAGRAPAPVYTNARDAIFLLTGRRVRPLPVRYSVFLHRRNRDFAREMDALHEAVAARRGVVVYFSQFGHRRFEPTEHELTETLRTGTELVRFEDGLLVRGKPR